MRKESENLQGCILPKSCQINKDPAKNMLDKCWYFRLYTNNLDEKCFGRFCYAFVHRMFNVDL